MVKLELEEVVKERDELKDKLNSKENEEII
jgi:hypothetical protein